MFMETVLKNHRTLITLLGLWATPFFIGQFKNIDKRRAVKPKKSTVFFSKGKKKDKERAFNPRSTVNDSTFDKEPASTTPLKDRLTAVSLILEENPEQLRIKPFVNEGPSKKESGLSPPLLVII